MLEARQVDGLVQQLHADQAAAGRQRQLGRTRTVVVRQVLHALGGIGPRLDARPAGSEDLDAYDAPDDLNLVFGRGATRFGRAIRPGGGAFREGSGRPGAPRDGELFRPSRDLAARRDAFAGGARSGTFGSTFAQRRAAQTWDDEHDGARPSPDDDEGLRANAASAGARAGTTGRPAPTPAIDRPVIPGERRYRDGDRVRHARWGDGIVVSSKLTRSDEEVTIAFRDPQVGRKTLLASLAALELTG